MSPRAGYSQRSARLARTPRGACRFVSALGALLGTQLASAGSVLAAETAAPGERSLPRDATDENESRADDGEADRVDDDGDAGWAALERESRDADGEFEAVAAVEGARAPATRRRLEAEELSRVPGSSGDPLVGVETLPGVSRSQDGAPILRGAAQHESAVFIEGFRVPLLYHLGGLRSVIHPRLVERVDVYPGNYPLERGRAVGGVVEARLRDARPGRPRGEVELSLLDSSALVEGSLGGGLSLAAAARRSNVDLVFERLVPDDAFSVRRAPLYWDYQGVLSWSGRRGHRVRLSALGSRDRASLYFDEPSYENPSLRGEVGGGVAFDRVTATHELSLGNVREELGVSVGRQRLDQRVGPGSQARFRATDFGARGRVRFSPMTELSLSFGVDVAGQAFEGTYRGPVAPAREGSPDVPDDLREPVVIDSARFHWVDTAAFVQVIYEPRAGVMLSAGSRVDHFGRLDAVAVNPGLGARVAVGDALTLKSAVGLFSQAPLYYETIEGIGNPELSPQRALHASLGAEASFASSLSFDVEGFYKYLWDRVVATEGSVSPHFESDGRGRVLGLETGLALDLPEALSLRVAYTLSRSQRRDRDEPYRLFDSDQTHVLSAAAGRELGGGFHLGARFRYVTGNPITPVVDSTYDAATGLYQPIFGAPGSERDPAFVQLDVRLDKRFDLGFVDLSLYLDVQNVTASDNAEGYQYSYDYRTRRPSASGGIFPNLGLRGEL